MTYPPAEPDLSQVCPHLGLGDDPDSHATYATEAHRCYRMPNPTRIAGGHQETYCLGANHVTCPIFTGEGMSRVAAPAAAASGMAAATASPPPQAPAAPGETAETVAGPARGGQRPSQRGRPATPPGGPRAKRPGGQDGQLRARPRAGGISMPAATIGLFALAIVLVAIAFLINQAVDDDGSSTLSEPDAFATQNANRTANAGSQTQTPQGNQTQPAGTQSPTGSPTQQGNQTPGATRTGTTTPGAGGRTYTVKSGDICGSIAEANNITLQQLLTANNMQEADCNTLQVGQILKLP